MDIQGKVVIITGASAGIGLATARRCAESGAKLVLTARSVDKLDQLARELESRGTEALSVQTDMRDPSSVQQMVQAAVRRFGKIDVLINNAGQAVAGMVADLDLEAFRQVFELNIMGVLYAIQAAVPEMRKTGGGLIVNISSRVSMMNIPGLSGYAATKAALNMLSQTARAELAGENIRVITVYPRMTATDFGKNSLGSRTVRDQQRAGGHPGGGPQAGQGTPVIDSPEYVADRIVQAIQEEPAEQHME